VALHLLRRLLLDGRQETLPASTADPAARTAAAESRG
jgi:hypothetical protein